jgi:hypothetical protein
MQSWLIPITIRALRGFLSLIGYHKKFIRDYGVISKPLTNLLKKMALSGLRQLL